MWKAYGKLRKAFVISIATTIKNAILECFSTKKQRKTVLGEKTMSDVFVILGDSAEYNNRRSENPECIELIVDTDELKSTYRDFLSRCTESIDRDALRQGQQRVYQSISDCVSQARDETRQNVCVFNRPNKQGGFYSLDERIEDGGSSLMYDSSPSGKDASISTLELYVLEQDIGGK